MHIITKKWAYYNEWDAKAAAWIRELIRRGLVAPGEVDERSILDIRPDELAPFCQVHLFAGVAAWSYSLRQAGWPDDRPVWTGSPPCQSFSAAGKGLGLADERHLWPVYYKLIQAHRPPVIFGEQVSSKAAMEWWDVVKADLNASGYATVAADIPASAFGAPHIRQRLYFVSERQGP